MKKLNEQFNIVYYKLRAKKKKRINIIDIKNKNIFFYYLHFWKKKDLNITFFIKFLITKPNSN